MLKCFQCKFPLLSDDTVIYCSASTPNQAQLQLAFNTVQHTLCDLKLVMFSNTNSEPLNFPSITTFQGSEIESASHYKYLGTAADYPLSFKPHIQQLVTKWNWVFYSRNKYCFSFEVTNFKALTYNFSLYALVGWSALSTCRLNHWHIVIYKVILGLLPSYLRLNIFQKSMGSYCLRSQDLFLLSIPKAHTKLEKGRLSMLLPLFGISCKSTWIFRSWSHWIHLTSK